MTEPLTVHVQFDPEAGVLVATSEDIPGLIVEAASWDELRAEIVEHTPFLLEQNGKPNEGRRVRLVCEETLELVA